MHGTSTTIQLRHIHNKNHVACVYQAYPVSTFAVRTATQTSASSDSLGMHFKCVLYGHDYEASFDHKSGGTVGCPLKMQASDRSNHNRRKRHNQCL